MPERPKESNERHASFRSVVHDPWRETLSPRVRCAMGFLQAGQRSVRSIAAPIQRSSRAWRALAVRGTAPRCSRAERVHAVCSVVGLDTYVKHGVKLAIAFLAALATLLACSDDEAPARRQDEVRPRDREQVELAPSYEVIDIGDAGSIAGSVRWLGPPPDAVMLPVRAHREVCGDEQPSLAVQVGRSGGVPDTVVWLVNVRRGAAIELPPEPPVITLDDCRFQPRVLAVAVGTSVLFRSADPVIHNVHAFMDGTSVWDFALPTEGSAQTRTVEAPGVLRLLSDVHSFMQGWLHAFTHPYFAVTDAEGRFRIASVPPGQYVMHVWHEGWRVVGTEAGRPRYSSPILLTRTVSVSQRQETTADFQLSRASAQIAGD